jgi:nicotinate-nucleotide adenylyltransferase
MKMKKSKNIGIFGGLFDPPHIGHLIIIQSVLEEFNLNKIIFIPAGNPPHKSRYSAYNIRYKMIELVIKKNKKFFISALEQKMSGKTYTIEVIKELKKKIKGRIYLIIGSDQWLEIETWKTPEELFEECEIIVVPRPNYIINKSGRFSRKILISHSPLIDISSTSIRKKIKQNRNIQYLVPQEVYKYIKRKRLYK